MSPKILLSLKATRGTVVCGQPPTPLWWCADLAGQRIPCVKIELGDGGAVRFIYDPDGETIQKLKGGRYNGTHRVIPIADLKSFTPEEARP